MPPETAQAEATTTTPAAPPASAEAPIAAATEAVDGGGEAAAEATNGEAAAEGGAETAEAAPPTPAAPTEADARKERLKQLESSKFAALSRKERELRKANEEFQAQKAQYEKLLQAQKLFDEDPNEALRMLGRDPLQVYNRQTMALLGKKEEPKSEEQRNLETLQQKIERLEKEAEERKQYEAKSAAESAVEQFNTSIATIIAAAPDDYEVLSAFGDDALQLVANTYVEYWQETGEQLPLDKAVALAEDRLTPLAQRLAKGKKFGGQTPAVEVAAPAAALNGAIQNGKKPTAHTGTGQTLTNRNSAAGGTPREMTDAERRTEAIRLMEKALGKRQ